jgi:hypothetical protein
MERNNKDQRQNQWGWDQQQNQLYKESTKQKIDSSKIWTNP